MNHSFITVTFVTGNANKLREVRQLAPSDINLDSHNLDLDEIQSLDLQAILTHKLHQAYGVLKTPVIVEDTSAGLASLEGLPGPFIKFFAQKLGGDALYKLSKVDHDAVTVTCLTGFYDGQRTVFGTGILRGHIVAPRGDGGFGFDIVIVPEGHDRTMAQMSAEEKNAISHRSLAFRDLFTQLQP